MDVFDNFPFDLCMITAQDQQVLINQLIQQLVRTWEFSVMQSLQSRQGSKYIQSYQIAFQYLIKKDQTIYNKFKNELCSKGSLSNKLFHKLKQVVDHHIHHQKPKNKNTINNQIKYIKEQIKNQITQYFINIIQIQTFYETLHQKEKFTEKIQIFKKQYSKYKQLHETIKLTINNKKIENHNNKKNSFKQKDEKIKQNSKQVKNNQEIKENKANKNKSKYIEKRQEQIKQKNEQIPDYPPNYTLQSLKNELTISKSLLIKQEQKFFNNNPNMQTFKKDEKQLRIVPQYSIVQKIKNKIKQIQSILQKHLCNNNKKDVQDKNDIIPEEGKVNSFNNFNTKQKPKTKKR